MPARDLPEMDPARTVRRAALAPHRLTSRVTPQRDLFVLAHMGLPVVDAAAWRLTIAGLVENPCTLSLGEIRALPKVEVESFHQCAGAPRRPDVAMRRVGNVVWGGADLAALLTGLGVGAAAKFLWSTGVDHGAYEDVSAELYVKDLPLSRLAEGGVLLAYEVNGEPLAREHGFPLRLVVPGFYGTNAVKWLTRIELAAERAPGPFTTLLYNDPAPGGARPVWRAPPECLIVAPKPGPLAVAASVEVWGWAWSAAGVARVEVSADGGASWAPASLEPRRQWSWQRFAFSWTALAAGPATLMARATDTEGVTQPMAKARNAVHAVTVAIDG